METISAVADASDLEERILRRFGSGSLEGPRDFHFPVQNRKLSDCVICVDTDFHGLGRIWKLGRGPEIPRRFSFGTDLGICIQTILR